MADNVGYTPGTGAIVAADEIAEGSPSANVLYQRIKLIHGANGTNDGDVSVSNPLPTSVAGASSATILSLTTAATGTNWTAFASTTCQSLDIVNTSSVAIEYRRGATGNSMTILSGSSRLVVGITNANQIDVRRVDTSNTQITIPAEAIVL
jgi:hypothetical protein